MKNVLNIARILLIVAIPVSGAMFFTIDMSANPMACNFLFTVFCAGLCYLATGFRQVGINS